MQLDELKQHFAGAIRPSILSDWELEELCEPLLDFPDEAQRNLLRQVGVIWPVSNSLCRNVLQGAGRALECLTLPQLGEWVKAILGRYEEGGLTAAQEIIDQIEANFLCLLRGETGISLQEISGRLHPYLQGISGEQIELHEGPEVSTDTVRIFLPPKLNLMPSRQENFLLYKLTATYQWGYTACGTFRVSRDEVSEALGSAASSGLIPAAHEEDGLSAFFSLFQDPSRAAALYHLLETIRVTAWLWEFFPGLMHDCRPLSAMLHSPAKPESRSPFASLYAGIEQAILDYEPRKSVPPTDTPVQENPAILFHRLRSNLDSLRHTYELCRGISPDDPAIPPPLFFQGTLNFREAFNRRMKKREEQREKFITALAVILSRQGRKPETPEESEALQGVAALADDRTAALIPPLTEKPGTGKPPETPREKAQEYLIVDDEHLDLPPDLQSLRDSIIDDLGRVPDQYISSARQRSGTGRALGSAPEAPEAAELAGKDLYDEWDYRRKGFRRNWCRLLQKEVAPVKGTYLDKVLEKYKGQLIRLRRQFEMLRTGERFVRRQNDGSDIDLDAMVDFLADSRRGIADGDGLFIRLKREERSIAAIFLVDMSSSTEGWVSNAIKESLILLSESLDVLGDSYGIYGFSGMRRLRSELFHIKRLDEPYNQAVKERIAAIAPMEYTRMGPPIRHLTGILAETDARIRLLITLSDGKPEDYDDYKGDYAIEDTRHALIEAKTSGIHPFCITIDRQAHEYISHMYGEVNYIFIDDVGKLPQRIPEIYRTLTT